VAQTLHIEIATPEKLVVDQQADYAEIPGKDGYMGILPGHAALLSELAHGKLTLTTGGKTESFTVTGGYVEVRDNHVRVLADGVNSFYSNHSRREL
jgi:F-type H+-transporting ATPase subunit epsilon